MLILHYFQPGENPVWFYWKSHIYINLCGGLSSQNTLTCFANTRDSILLQCLWNKCLISWLSLLGQKSTVAWHNVQVVCVKLTWVSWWVLRCCLSYSHAWSLCESQVLCRSAFHQCGLSLIGESLLLTCFWLRSKDCMWIWICRWNRVDGRVISCKKLPDPQSMHSNGDCVILAQAWTATDSLMNFANKTGMCS